MNLSKKLAREFDSAIRSRGASYYFGGQVHVDAGSSTQTYAHVIGSRKYQTTLEWEDGILYAVCDCPYFDSDGACKHLWATILAAEARGHLSKAVSAPVVVMDFGSFDPESDDDYLLDEDDEDEDEDDDEDEVPVFKRSIAPPPPKPPSWQTQIEGIVNVRRHANNASDAWPAKREIVYIVDVPCSLTTGSLVLAIASHDRKQDGSFSRITPLSMRTHQVAQLPVAADREILSALAGGSQYYGW